MSRRLFQYHPTIGYHFIPGLKARVSHEGGGYLFRTNSAGFRCRHDFAAPRQDGTRRVLLFGDSYTAGDGVSDGKRYGDVLEELRPELEVFNFGLSGSGTDQQYLIFKEMAATLDYDIVVIGVLVENIRRVAARYRPSATGEGDEVLLAKPYYSLTESGDLELSHVPVPRKPLSLSELSEEDVDRGGRHEWIRKAVNRMGPQVKDTVQRLTRYQPLPQYDSATDPSWELMKAILERWIGEVEAPVILMPIPLYQYVEETASAKAYQARFRELENKPRVTVHDPLPDFWRYTKAERRGFRFERDCHLTPAAHRLMAESLATATDLL